MRKKVYVSVYDYTGLTDYLNVLSDKFNYDIFSSGSTLEYLNKNGLNAEDISELGIADGFYARTFLEDFIRKNFDMPV